MEDFDPRSTGCFRRCRDSTPAWVRIRSAVLGGARRDHGRAQARRAEFVVAGDRLAVRLRYYGRGKGSGAEIETEMYDEDDFPRRTDVRMQYITDWPQAFDYAGLLLSPIPTPRILILGSEKKQERRLLEPGAVELGMATTCASSLPSAANPEASDGQDRRTAVREDAPAPGHRFTVPRPLSSQIATSRAFSSLAQHESAISGRQRVEPP